MELIKLEVGPGVLNLTKLDELWNQTDGVCSYTPEWLACWGPCPRPAELLSELLGEAAEAALVVSARGVDHWPFPLDGQLYPGLMLCRWASQVFLILTGRML